MCTQSPIDSAFEIRYETLRIDSSLAYERLCRLIRQPTPPSKRGISLKPVVCT